MDLANMRRQGVHRLIAYCLHDSCRHRAVIDVSSYPGDTPVPWFRSKMKCGKFAISDCVSASKSSSNLLLIVEQRRNGDIFRYMTDIASMSGLISSSKNVAEIDLSFGMRHLYAHVNHVDLLTFMWRGKHVRVDQIT